MLGAVRTHWPAWGSRLLRACCWALAGCGAGRLEQRGAPDPPFDALIVPGCPSRSDGSLSSCQTRRVLWAARIWDLGWTRHIITSGAAAHSPYIEAEALAAALAALGVPAERIYIEPDALHTDENMYFSMRIARALALKRLAVASEPAAWSCKMLIDWGQRCAAVTLDEDWVDRQYEAAARRLAGVRTPLVAPWAPLEEQERRIEQRTGRSRPGSLSLYLSLGLRRLSGKPWVPAGAPPTPPRETWAARRARLADAGH